MAPALARAWAAWERGGLTRAFLASDNQVPWGDHTHPATQALRDPVVGLTCMFDALEEVCRALRPGGAPPPSSDAVRGSARDDSAAPAGGGLPSVATYVAERAATDYLVSVHGVRAPRPGDEAAEYVLHSGATLQAALPGHSTGKTETHFFALCVCGPGVSHPGAIMPRGWSRQGVWWYAPLGTTRSVGAASTTDASILAKRLGIHISQAGRPALLTWATTILRPYFRQGPTAAELVAWTHGCLPTEVPTLASTSAHALISWLEDAADATEALFDTAFDPVSKMLGVWFRAQRSRLAAQAAPDARAFAHAFKTAVPSFNHELRSLAREPGVSYAMVPDLATYFSTAASEYMASRFTSWPSEPSTVGGGRSLKRGYPAYSGSSVSGMGSFRAAKASRVQGEHGDIASPALPAAQPTAPLATAKAVGGGGEAAAVPRAGGGGAASGTRGGEASGASQVRFPPDWCWEHCRQAAQGGPRTPCKFGAGCKKTHPDDATVSAFIAKS